MKQHGATLDFLHHFESLGIPLIDCLVYQHGKCVFRYQSGYSDEACRKPVDGTERYNIYSCSKVITCTAALQLVEQDLIRLEDPVYEYLPEFRHLTKKNKDGKLEEVRTPMTIRHLFTMTAGLTYNLKSENLLRGIAETSGRMPTREAMKYLALDPLVFEPGSGWNYSLGHDVLAAVVEVVSGKRFGLYVKEKIFDPLGMKHSTFLLPENELGEIAAQYRYDPETRRYNRCGPEIQSHKLGTEYESGGAGCISTVDDYMLFLENLRSGERLLKRGTIARMTCPQVSKAIEKQYWGCAYHSYGLGVRCPKPGTGFYDYGWSGAAGAFLAIIPDADVSIYSAQHVLNSPASAIHGELCVKVLKDLQ